MWQALQPQLAAYTKPRVVTVAGTNGKGSTVAMIETGLSALGFAVGSYTSPHIHHYNERVKLSTQPVDDQKLIASFELIENARGDTPLTYFEFGTLSALVILFSENLDVICLEIGLGGRLDAVNIIDAEVAVITSIGLDHVDWLGDDIAQIGREKAGILRPRQTALLGENLPQSVYEEAEMLGTHIQTYGVEFDLKEDLVDLNLPPNNIGLALKVIEYFSKGQDLSSVYKALNKLSLPGRLERCIAIDVTLYLDVAHNSHAAAYLAKFAQRLIDQGNKIVAVYSSLEDKDSAAVVAELSEKVDRWFIASLDAPRAMGLESLRVSVYEGLTKLSDTRVGEAEKNVLSFARIQDAIAASLAYSVEGTDAGKPVVVLVFGSFFVVEAAKNFLQGMDG